MLSAHSPSAWFGGSFDLLAIPQREIGSKLLIFLFAPRLQCLQNDSNSVDVSLGGKQLPMGAAASVEQPRSPLATPIVP